MCGIINVEGNFSANESKWLASRPRCFTPRTWPHSSILYEAGWTRESVWPLERRYFL